ncbi:MAG: type IV secretion system DNA-binding domain-containing protein [Alphaproteobacteria bacterium]|nr:type IV secretion system DNA-binding domain-containing protein [Alphaproteobacteria bacterium]
MFGGRSNFGNFFLGSARDREAAETSQLYNRVAERFAASQFSRERWLSDFAVSLVYKAAERVGAVPIDLVGIELSSFVAKLIRADGLAMAPPQVTSFHDLPVDQAMALRRNLRRRERFLEDSDRLLQCSADALVNVAAEIMRALPPSLFADDGGATQGEAFRAPLMDLCENPARLIERSIMAFYTDDLTSSGLFDPLRDTISHNFCVASGIDPRKSGDSKPFVFPSKAKGKSSAELVRSYCGGTPFQDILEFFVPFSVPFPARFEHTHIVGGSGHGKTQLMQSMIYDDLLHAKEDGRSLIVIDSQGDLITTISHLECFAPGEYGDLGDKLVIIDPTDIEYPVCLNLFDWGTKTANAASPVEREKLLNSAIALYEYIFGALLGAELTQKQGVIFKYLARLMLEIPDATIHTLAALMEDGEPFRPYMDRLAGSARQFFTTRFFDRSFNETKKQILTRLWGVLSNGTLERIFGNPSNKVDLFEAMNSGKIVLINTAKDVLTQDGSALLGRFFIALIAQAAMQRASIAPHERRPCFVYIDEAADYFDDTVEHLLNQARKYKVGLVLSQQNLDQASTGLRASLMASTSIKFAGGVSGKDARALAEEMRCDPEFLQGMRKRKDETEFGCFIRQFTPTAIAVTAPLGFVEKQPRLSPEDYKDLLASIRSQYCIPLEEVQQYEPPPRETKEAPPPKPPVAEQPVPPESQPTVPTHEPVQPQRPAQPKMREAEPSPMGRGGKQHKYLQHLIKQMAEERGWRTVIEEPILDGTGRVDVSLSRGERRIACEISVTSTRDQELANVEKCLVAGFAEVILVAESDRQREMLHKYVASGIDETDRSKVRYLIPEELLPYLESQEPPTEQTIRGYRVRVTHELVDAAEAEAKRKAIAAVIARSLRRSSD